MVKYIVIVQCHLVTQRCSGYYCEQAFQRREGGFAQYPAERPFRTLYLSCGGCCGRAVQRKLSHLCQVLKKQEQIEKPEIAVQLSSCITNDNYHGPPCPHLDYLRTLITRLGLTVFDGTHLSTLAEQRRAEGRYQPRAEAR